MNIEKIEINGHYVWVDKDAEIKDGDWMIRPNENPILVTPTFWWDFGVKYDKIIAGSPELNLEGVSTYVEWLADIDSKNHYKDQSDYWAIGYDSFKRGYQTAEKELPSDEEIENRIKTHNPYPKQKQMHIDWSNGFERGAKWMRDKIQGGNQ